MWFKDLKKIGHSNTYQNNLSWFISFLWMILKKLFLHQLLHFSEAYLVEREYRTNIKLENGSSDNDKSDDDEYNFDELEFIKI